MIYVEKTIFGVRRFDLAGRNLTVNITGFLRRSRSFTIPIRAISGPCEFGTATPPMFLYYRKLGAIFLLPGAYFFFVAVRDLNDLDLAISTCLSLIATSFF